jgi:hypothetical protein
VRPDRRGFAPGARWEVSGTNRPSLLRAPNPTGMLIVLAVEPPTLFRFQLTGERIEAELRLRATAPDRTLATLAVEGPWLVGLRRSFAHKALSRLHALCQTAAGL